MLKFLVQAILYLKYVWNWLQGFILPRAIQLRAKITRVLLVLAAKPKLFERLGAPRFAIVANLLNKFALLLSCRPA
jgi:hypothetical protein